MDFNRKHKAGGKMRLVKTFPCKGYTIQIWHGQADNTDGYKAIILNGATVILETGFFDCAPVACDRARHYIVPTDTLKDRII